jgi:sialic acid synthase SpsE
LNDLGSHGFKVASGDLLNVPLLRKLGSFGKPVFLSTGAANIEEIKFAVGTLKAAGLTDLCVMHCTLCYPTRVGDANLAALQDIAANFPDCVLGLSDHTIGDLVPALSTMFGCKVVEKHFTTDKTLPDSADHWLSVDENELASLVRNMEKAVRAQGSGSKAMLDCEIPTRLNARRSLVVSGTIKKGEKFTEENVVCKRPGTGISARYYDDLVGLTATNDLNDDHLISIDDVLEDCGFKPITDALLKENYDV